MLPPLKEVVAPAANEKAAPHTIQKVPKMVPRIVGPGGMLEAKTPSPKLPSEELSTTTKFDAPEDLAVTTQIKEPAKTVTAKTKANLATTVNKSVDLETYRSTRRDKPIKAPVSREQRSRRARMAGALFFYAILLFVVCPSAYFTFLGSSLDTRLDGQVIPPSGTTLHSEVWVVSEFPDLHGYSDDLMNQRAPVLQKIAEMNQKLNQVKDDIAARTARLRLLQAQQDETRQQIAKIVVSAKQSAGAIWANSGAALDAEYTAKLATVKSDIQQHANALKIDYQTNDDFEFPDAWANAFRLAMYGVPPSSKKLEELKWLDGELVDWHSFEAGYYAKKETIKDQVSQTLASNSQAVAQINQQIDDLNRKIGETTDDLQPILHEQEQDQEDINNVENTLVSYEPKYMQELSGVPAQYVLKKLPIKPDGRFEWLHEDKDQKFAEGEKFHRHWLFFRAIRDSDGREFWSLAQVIVTKNDTLEVAVLPGSFQNLRALLRPDLSPDEL
jgi:TolA-binding protein